MFIPFSVLAAGLAISRAWLDMYVADYENDSLSAVSTATREVLSEVTFSKPGFSSPAIGENAGA